LRAVFKKKPFQPSLLNYLILFPGLIDYLLVLKCFRPAFCVVTSSGNDNFLTSRVYFFRLF